MTSASTLKVACFCFLAFLLLLIFGCPASAQTGPVAAIVAGNVLDLASTEKALLNPSLRESNPILSNSRPQRLILKSASTALQGWIVYRLGKTHPRLAKVVGYSAGGFLSGIALHNTRVDR